LVDLRLESLYIPDVVFLVDPAREISLSWSPSLMSVRIPEVSLLLLGNGVGTCGLNALSEIPFGLDLTLTKLEIAKEATNEMESILVARGIFVALRPAGPLHFRAKVMENQ